eukprot:TRINITY_DN10569_c0_g1_i3.p1 TRINITY_DN10569_c0_g1~~TRINITY_DN10569_c0_g1_i3.p1  ORF type:complete len:149 (+),score=26.25 TRINITY_DN10569_c0_g1_i3:250-696(+)
MQDAEDNDYIEYKYADIKLKQLIFNVPERPGTYEFRYHSKAQSKFVHVVKSVSFTVHNENRVYAEGEACFIKVTWNIQAPKISSSDWVAMYKVGSLPKNHICWSYVDLKRNYVLFDKPPNQSGRYFVRYFSYSMPKFEPLVESSVLEM